MLFGRTDLPLERDALGRFLPWLIAFMVFLAILSMAGALVLTGLSKRWDKGLSATLTIEIAPDVAPDGALRPPDAEMLERVLATVRERSGVVSAAVVPPERVNRLLEPWLGGAAQAADLPLPTLIDVSIDPDRPVDVQALSRRLAAVSDAIAVDDHRLWLDRLLSLFRAVEALAAFVVTLIAVATVGTVVFTTRTGLAVHGDAIEVLHLIGAHDSYIARQFARRALLLGLQGGVIGAALAVPALMAASELIGALPADVLPAVTLRPWHWAALAVTPLGVAVLAMVTARITVLRTLARMV
jgi:cell division transport system permease protein